MDLAKHLVQNFLESSSGCLEVLRDKLSTLREDAEGYVVLDQFEGEKKTVVQFDRKNFFLRASTEYSNPQLTVEDVQGIISARLLEACGNYFTERDIGGIESSDILEICELLRKPPSGKLIPFLLNVDDVEPDRYSMNPLRSSILKTGQSAFPAASVRVEDLEIDLEFFSKYEGALISKKEIDLIDYCLNCSSGSYVDFADMVKYSQLQELSELFGIDLNLPSLRLPLGALVDEGQDSVIKRIIERSHVDYESIEKIYSFMGRSMKNRTTLLTVPHSKKGFGSKRAARGKIYFKDGSLARLKVRYKPSLLYPNAIDPEDTSIAKGEDSFIVEGEHFIDYSYSETPSSPQFILYSLASPEDACLWHSIGAWGSKELVRSYTSTHMAYAEGTMFKELVNSSNLMARMPVQFNLVPKGVWVHPEHRNIDASIGCVEDLNSLVKQGIWIEHLSVGEYLRR